MSHTVIRQTLFPDSLFTTYKGLHRVEFDSSEVWDFRPFGTAGVIKVDNIENDSLVDSILLSDRHKVLFSPNIGLYNFFNVSVGALFSEIKNLKDYILLIDPAGLGPEKSYSYFQFFLKSLDDLGIEWKFFTPPQKFYINNFSLNKGSAISPEVIDEVYNTYIKYVKNKDVRPFRKVYLSRRHMPDRNYFWLKDGLSITSDNRLYDHDTLESYLKIKGFEVVIPEEKFLNFEDQINYFYETKLLVSLSSSGISNSIFMQKNTSVVELMTSYPQALATIESEQDLQTKQEGVETVHHIYHGQAYQKGHAYFGIPNYTRKSNDIIKYIEDNEYLNLIFSKE